MISTKSVAWPAVAALLLAALLPRPAAALPQYEKDFEAHLGLEQEYTDNLQLMTVQGGEDFISSLRPGFSLSAVSEKSGVKLAYDFAYSQYWKLDDGFTRHNAQGNVWQEWEHWRFDCTGAFSRQEYPLEVSPETGVILGLRDTVSPYYRTGATPGLSYQFGEERFVRAGYNYNAYWSNDPRFQNSEMSSPNVNLTYGLDRFNVLQVGYTYETSNFSQGTFSNMSDFVAHRPSGSFTHRFNPRLELTTSYAYSNLAFDTGGGYKTHTATLGATYALSEQTSMSLSAGYYQINLNGQTQDGPVLNGSLTRRFSRGEVTLSGDWGFGEDYYTSENLGVYKYWSGRASASYQLAEYLKADAGGSYRSSDYVLEGRTDDYWNATAGLTWDVRPWLKARAAYYRTNYETVSGTGFLGRTWDFTVNNYSISLTATYD